MKTLRKFVLFGKMHGEHDKSEWESQKLQRKLPLFSFSLVVLLSIYLSALILCLSQLKSTFFFLPRKNSSFPLKLSGGVTDDFDSHFIDFYISLYVSYLVAPTNYLVLTKNHNHFNQIKQSYHSKMYKEKVCKKNM